MTADSRRGVRSVAQVVPLDEGFDPSRSQAVVVGVSRFPHGELDPPGGAALGIAPIPFAVDDAIDVAHQFSLDLELVRPERLTLLLEGEPRKPVSRERLLRLRAGGARERPPTRVNILQAVRLAALHTPAEGLLLLLVATHGLSERGEDYLLGSDALRDLYEDTAVKTATVLRLVRDSPARRRLVLIDACREQVDAEGGRQTADRRTALRALLLAETAEAEGQQVLFGARPGCWAYDDDSRGNGVFTSALLDSLQCAACSESERIITLGELRRARDRRVAGWMAAHRPNGLPGCRGISWIGEGSIEAMPVAACAAARGEPARCRNLRLVAIDLHGGVEGGRRLPLAGGKVVLPFASVQGWARLEGTPRFEGTDALPLPCSCEWQELSQTTGEWTRMDTGPDCSFSVRPPRPGRAVSLRLRLCGSPSQGVDLVAR